MKTVVEFAKETLFSARRAAARYVRGHLPRNAPERVYHDPYFGRKPKELDAIMPEPGTQEERAERHHDVFVKAAMRIGAHMRNGRRPTVKPPKNG